MANTTTAAGASAAAPLSLPARVIGIITSPRATFQAVVSHPKWFGMLALVAGASAVLIGGFMFTQVGQDAWLDAATNSAFSRNMTDQQYARMEQMASFAGYFAVAQMLIFTPILYLVVAAILFAVFNAALGGDATFRQVFAVVVHVGPIFLLSQLFTIPLNYARGTMSSATNLRVLLPMIDEGSFAGRLLGMIELFLIWQLIALAIGLGVLYKRRTAPIATSLLVIYAVIATVAAAILSRVGVA